MNDAVEIYERLDEMLTDIATIMKEAKYYDDNLGSTIQQALGGFKDLFSELIKAIPKQEAPVVHVAAPNVSVSPEAPIINVNPEAPVINMQPNISVNMQPVQDLARNISEQNNAIMGMIAKIPAGDNELVPMMRAMVLQHEKYVSIIENMFDKINELVRVANARPEVDHYDIVRSGGGLPRSIKPVYKN